MRARLAAVAILASLPACGGVPAPAPANEAAAARPASEPEPVAGAPHAEPGAPRPSVPAQPPDDHPGVAELSPSQRRAYERGYRDCREGRYQPGEWAEAYRIGCAAAQEAG